MSLRVCVTGAAGFIGSHMAERLIAEGHEVVGVDCFSANYSRERKERNLSALAGEPRFALVEAEMCAPAAIEALRGCDALIHMAAVPGVRTSDTELLWRVNVRDTGRLLGLLADANVRRVVLTSSSSIYGSSQVARSERDRTRPASEYARSKLAAERLCLCSGLHAVVLRYFTVFGPRQRLDMAFAAFIDAALGGRAAPLFSARAHVRQFTFVADVVDATVLALERAPGGAVYNVAGPHPATVEHGLRTIERLLGRAVPVQELPAHRADALDCRASTERARSELGWVARTELDEGLRAQVDYALGERRLGVDRAHVRLEPPAELLNGADA
jgi:UDP-glucuronate 4-epimerase